MCVLDSRPDPVPGRPQISCNTPVRVKADIIPLQYIKCGIGANKAIGSMLTSMSAYSKAVMYFFFRIAKGRKQKKMIPDHVSSANAFIAVRVSDSIF